jgi:Spy/CpxP family protein refolding chaperone
MMRALRWQIAVGLLLVFIAGAATGFLAGAWHAHNAFLERHDGMMSERMRERWKRQLDLTPDQIRDVNPILDRTAAELQKIRSETGERVRQALEETDRELQPHLTPEQGKKLEQIKWRHLHRKHGGGRRHGGAPSDES